MKYYQILIIFHASRTYINLAKINKKMKEQIKPVGIDGQQKLKFKETEVKDIPYQSVYSKQQDLQDINGTEENEEIQWSDKKIEKQKNQEQKKNFFQNNLMPPKKFKKYARSTSPSRVQQNNDPSPSKEQSDFNFLIGALTSRILEKGLMDNKFLKNFFLNRDDQKKNKQEQVNIVEKKIIQCLRFPKKIQNQATIRLIEEFAKEKGFTIENSIKYQQYEILKKPIIFQPTIFVTKDENWYDIFEQFKSENLNIIPNQNLQDFNNLINNQQLHTWEKLQYILKQKFMIHNASEFPDDNPVIGNEDQDGNLQFILDENLIPHRVIFKNKDEYELLNWYTEHKNKRELNIVKQNWSTYIQNVQKLRDKKPIGQERKIIQLNTQMQIEIEKANQPNKTLEIKLKQNAPQQQQQQQVQNKQTNQNPLKPQQEQIQRQDQQVKNNQQSIKQQSNTQIQQQNQDQIRQQSLQKQIDNRVKEIKQQNLLVANQIFEQDMEKINKLTLDELADQVLSDFGITLNPSNINTQLQEDEKMLITVQFPIEIKNKQQIKTLKNNIEEEQAKGFIYLNENEIIKLDQEIKNSLYNIGFKERKILNRGQEYTMTSPYCVQTTLMPLNMARQWMYFKNNQAVKVYIIQAQTFWIFQQLFSDKTNKSQAEQAQSYVQFTYQNYVDKWINFVNTNSTIWKKTSEDAIQAKAQTISSELINKSDDQDASHYSLKIIEDVWFTFSCVKQFILVNTLYDVKQTILFYLNIKGEFFEPTISVNDLLTGMWGYGIGIQMSPIFEPTFTHDVVCWLCYGLFNSWENFYIHKCSNSQTNAKSSFKQDHLLVWRQFKSK